MCSLIDGPTESGDVSALRQLYQSIILQAFKDAAGAAKEVPVVERKQAQTWLLGGSARLKEICEGAGYAMSDIRGRARHMARLGWQLPSEMAEI